MSETKKPFRKMSRNIYGVLGERRKTLLDFRKLNGTALKISFDVLVDFVLQCHVPKSIHE